jgi:hypothetical protein
MLDQHRAWNLQCDVAEKENTSAQAEHAVAESQVAGHAERSVGHTGAVNVIRDVKKKKERQQSSGDLTPRAIIHFSASRCKRGRRLHNGPKGNLRDEGSRRVYRNYALKLSGGCRPAPAHVALAAAKGCAECPGKPRGVSYREGHQHCDVTH